MKSWPTSCYKSNLFSWFTFFSINCIDRIERITNSCPFWHTLQILPSKFIFLDSTSMTFVSDWRFSTINVFCNQHVNLSRVFFRSFPRSLGLASFNIFENHIIPNEVRRSWYSTFEFCQIVLGVLRINSLSCRLKFNALRFCTFYIMSYQWVIRLINRFM